MALWVSWEAIHDRNSKWVFEIASTRFDLGARDQKRDGGGPGRPHGFVQRDNDVW